MMPLGSYIQMKLRKLRFAELELDDGTKLQVEQIGKGFHTTCYRHEYSQMVYLVVESADQNKDMLVSLTEKFKYFNLPSTINPCIPETSYIGSIGDKSVYRQWYYKPLTAKAKDAWEQYKILKSVFDAMHDSHIGNHNNSNIYTYIATGNIFRHDYVDALQEQQDLKREIVEAFQLMNQYIDDNMYGSENMWIDFRKCNFALDTQENLILLDLIFDRSAWQGWLDGKQNKNRNSRY